MRMHAQRATTGQKEPEQTWLILGTFFTQEETKLGQINSCHFKVLDYAI